MEYFSVLMLFIFVCLFVVWYSTELKIIYLCGEAMEVSVRCWKWNVVWVHGVPDVYCALVPGV